MKAVMKEIDIERLRPGKYQPRQEPARARIAELAESVVATQGVIQPIVVRQTTADSNGADYEIVAGERRWRASQEARHGKVNCVIIEGLDDEEAAVFSLLENLDREGLNSVEIAEALRRLREEFGWRQKEIARRLGKSTTEISRLIGIHRLPRPIQKHLEEGRIQIGHAKAVMGPKIPDAVKVELINRAVESHMTVAQVEALARDARAGKEPRRSPEDEFREICERLQGHLSARVSLERGQNETYKLRIDSSGPLAIAGVFERLAELAEQLEDEPNADSHPARLEISGDLTVFRFLDQLMK